MSQLTQTISGTTPFPGTPQFLAKVNPPVLNVTGDGTVYTVIFNSEIFDVGSNYDNTTGVFTAPVTGTYLFNVQFDIRALAANHTSGNFDLITTTRPYALFRGNCASMRDSISILDIGATVFAQMNVGNTAFITIRVQNGAKDVDLFGEAANQNTFWEGYFLG